MNFQLTNYFVRVIRRSNFTQGQRIADLTRPSLNPHFVKLKAITCNLSAKDHIYFQKKLSSSVKVSHFRVDRSFSNIHNCHLCLLLLAYHLGKFYYHSLSGFRKQGVQGFRPNLGQKCPIYGVIGVFSAYSQLSPLLTYGPLSCEISGKSLMWIPKTSFTRFLAQFRIKMFHFEIKKSFSKIFNFLTFVCLRPS